MENSTFQCFDASSFVSRSGDAKLPDAIIKFAIKDTPDIVKDIIEHTCFDDANLQDLPERKQMDAMVLNGIIWVLEQMKAGGSPDFQGVLDSYQMPAEYRKLFMGMLKIDDILNPKDTPKDEGVWNDEGWSMN